jgi:hypothetical protein
VRKRRIIYESDDEVEQTAPIRSRLSYQDEEIEDMGAVSTAFVGDTAEQKRSQPLGTLTLDLNLEDAIVRICAGKPDPFLRIHLQGKSKYPAFGTGLHDYVEVYLQLDSTNMTPEWFEILHASSVDDCYEWHSSMTLPQSKALLNQDVGPRVAQLMALPQIAGSRNPGDYVGSIITDRKLHDGYDSIYFGSATGPARELEYRTDEHLDPDHRKRERELTRSFHYNVIDQENGGRVAHYRKFVETTFLENSIKHIDRIRSLCRFAEQIYMC